MICGPTERFVDLMRLLTPEPLATLDDVEISSALGRQPKSPTQEQLSARTEYAMRLLGLKAQNNELLGQYLVLPGPDGTQLQLSRTYLYSFASLEDVLVAAGQHLAEIAKHGLGRVWFLDRPVHYVEHDGLGVRIVALPRGPLYLLRTMYGHEAQAVPR